MANAQDEAFGRLLAQRGVVGDDVVSRAMNQPGGSLVHTLVHGRVLAPKLASGILRELAAGSFSCQQCRQVLAYDALSFLEHLSCPRCRVPLEFRLQAPPPLGLPPQPDPRSRRSPQRGPGVGKTIGPYTLVKELGRGSNGVVFLAERAGLERPFALKVLLSTSFDDEEAVARFKLEAAVASKLDETGVISVYDIGHDCGHYYYAMEYCPGVTLQDLIQQGPLTPRRAAKILSKLATTTHHAHEMGIIHRDLKPANVILDERTGVARITDFGLARAPEIGGNLTRTGDVLGTPYYMAPEQLRGGAEVEPSIDTYALGVILYECLCGTRPFEAATVLELSKLVQNSNPQPLTKQVPGLPAELEAICKRAMAKRPWARYRNAQDMAEDLERFLKGEIPLAALEAPSRDAVEIADRAATPGGKKLFLALFVVLLSATTLVAVVAARRRGLLTRSPQPTPDVPETAAPPAIDLGIRLAALQDAARAGGPTDEILAELDALAAEVSTHAEATAELTLTRAELFLRRSRFEECLATLETLPPETGPSDPRRLWARAVALERLSRQGAALQSYDALAEHDPQGVWGLTAAAAASRLRERLPEGLRLAEDALGADRDHVPALVELALLSLLVDNDAARAEGLLHRAERLAPDESRVLFGLAMVAGSRRPREALEILDRLITLTEPLPMPQALALRSRVRLYEGEIPGALQDVSEVLQRDPRHLESLFLRGMINWRTQQREPAKADWDLCYELSSGVFRQLLRSWPDLAEQVRVRQVLRLDDEGVRHTKVFFEVSEALRERLTERAKWAGDGARGPLAEALVKAAEGYPWSELAPFFAAAVEAAPHSKVVALEQARVLVGREEYELALTEIRRARDVGANRAELLRLEGEVWWTRGKRHIAAERYWDRVAADDQGIQGLCAMARTLGTRSDAYEEDAWTAVDRALSLEPDHAPSLIAKGLLLDPSEQENVEELQRTLDHVLELQGYLDAQVFHLRLNLVLAPLAEDQVIDKEDRWVIDLVLGEYEDWALVSSGVTHLMMAAQLIMIMPERELKRRARRYLEEAHALEPKRGSPLMYLGFLKLIMGKKPPRESEVLDCWRRAREVEPMITMPPDWIDVYEQRYDNTRRLDELGIPASER